MALSFWDSRLVADAISAARLTQSCKVELAGSKRLREAALGTHRRGHLMHEAEASVETTRGSALTRVTVFHLRNESGDNSYIFPGVGLGAIASGARRVTDEMFMSAARTLANLVEDSDLEQGSLYPALPRIRDVSAHIAVNVARVAYERGLPTVPAPEDLPAHIRSQMYEPVYRSYLPT
jgi:malic enzyme